jgi:hypothetical protein
MKASELRIGNYFIPIMDNGCILPARPIRAAEFFLLSEKPDSALPVLIDDNMLASLGCKDGILGAFVIEKGLNDIFQIPGYDIRLRIDDSNSVYIKVIKHLHELQNIYLDITGTELNIKL